MILIYDFALEDMLHRSSVIMTICSRQRTFQSQHLLSHNSLHPLYLFQRTHYWDTCSGLWEIKHQHALSYK